MTKRNVPANQKELQAELAPETHNDEQDDQRNQAQQVAAQAKGGAHNVAGGTESLKVASPGVDNIAGSESDLIDEMRKMEDTGKIDNGAFSGEPNHDDDSSKYDD